MDRHRRARTLDPAQRQVEYGLVAVLFHKAFFGRTCSELGERFSADYHWIGVEGPEWMNSDDNYTSWYLAEINTAPPLSADEEICCVQHIRAGDRLARSAGERLVEANLRLVVSIAERYRAGLIPIPELIMQGNNALVAALDTFNNSGDDSFAAHVTPKIERAIAEAIASPSSAGVSGYFRVKANESAIS
jgi:DNA-directed RNA polymerase sigma subunit (sigma70/sigma32)